jgi:hypothetical protein
MLPAQVVDWALSGNGTPMSAHSEHYLAAPVITAHPQEILVALTGASQGSMELLFFASPQDF